VEGNRAFTRDQILAVAALRVGQTAGKAEFDAARDRLVATGAFEKVSYKFVPGKGQGFSATFTVDEVDQVYPVEFERLGVSSLELKATLAKRDPLFGDGKLPASQIVLERYTKWIQEFLASKGIKDEKIAGMVLPAATAGDFAIVFQPVRALPSVAQVTFEGNEVLSETALREAIAPTGIGAPYTEDTFRQVLRTSIRPLYETRGRVRVAFPKIRTEPVSDVAGLHVFVTVDEGPVFELGKVSFDSPTPLPADSLLRSGDFKSGDVANMSRVSEGLERIRKVAARAGYTQAKVTSEPKINDEKKTVDVILHLDPGPQYVMGKLAIQGLDLEGEAAIKKMWGLREGKPYNPEYPDAFFKSVREQAMFDNLGQTKAQTKVNEQDKTVDVTLVFGGADAKSRPGRRRPGGM
jgi:outer membrane protein assembly factor BamA